MSVYNHSAMKNYYDKQQSNDFTVQSYQKVQQDHVKHMAINETLGQNHYTTETNRKQFSAEEQKIIEQYEKKLQWEKEQHAKSMDEQDQARKQKQQLVEQKFQDVKKQRAIAQHPDLILLRKTIDVANVSQANHQAIQQNLQKAKDKRIQDKDEHNKNLQFMEDKQQKKQQERDDFVNQQRQDIYNHMVESQKQKKQKNEQDEQDRLDLEKQLVEQTVQAACKDREMQTQKIKDDRQTLINNEKESKENQRKERERKAKLEKDLEDRIKQYNEAQQQRLDEREKARQYHQVSFDALLKQMADINKQREEKIIKMENLRIQLAQFYEDARRLQREKADEEARIRIRKTLLEFMEQNRIERKKKEEQEVQQEDFYKNQIISQYKESLEKDKTMKQQYQDQMQQYKNDIEEQILNQRQQRMDDEEIQRQQEEKALQEAGYDEEAQQIYNQERERLIKECASKVYFYMDQSLISHNDLKMLPAEIQNQLQQMKRDKQYLDMGAVGADDIKQVDKVVDKSNEKVLQKTIDEKKRQYKSALPW